MPRMLALLLGLIALAPPYAAHAETLKVAVAQRGFWDSTMVDIAEKQGFFKEAGLEIEVLYTEGGASTLTPVLAGSIDIAMSNGILGVIGAYSKGAGGPEVMTAKMKTEIARWEPVIKAANIKPE